MQQGLRKLGVCFAMFALLLSAACASRPKPAPNDYSGQAEYSYKEAQDSLEGGEYLDAIKRFNFVRTKFPYSEFAALAMVRIGDTYFEQGDMPEAIQAYRRFAELHPTHPEVAYARYRIGLAHFDELPGDWFIMPPPHERDLQATEDAARELRKFLDLHPNTPYTDDVGEKLKLVRRRLADHEYYVATFYLGRDEPRAAAMRLERLLGRFPGLGYEPEAMYLLGKCYLLLNDVNKAAKVWTSLRTNFPDEDWSAEVAGYMEKHGIDLSEND